MFRVYSYINLGSVQADQNSAWRHCVDIFQLQQKIRVESLACATMLAYVTGCIIFSGLETTFQSTCVCNFEYFGVLKKCSTHYRMLEVPRLNFYRVNESKLLNWFHISNEKMYYRVWLDRFCFQLSVCSLGITGIVPG